MWNLSDEWRWTRSGAAHEAASGQGFLLLEPSTTRESVAISPLLEVDASGVWCLEFMAMYDLEQDTIMVTVSNATEILVQEILTGDQQEYDLHVIEFSALGSDLVEAEWRCARGDTMAPAGSFSLDDVQLVLVMSGDPDRLLPTTLTVRGPWPNPARGQMTWSLTVPHAGIARVETYDLAGRLARTDRLGLIEAGQHSVTLPSSGLTSGVYVAKFLVGRALCSRMFVQLD
jgi:hypothetical protein